MNKGLFVKTLAVVLLVCVVLCCTLVVVVDPFFHFHKPILALSYPLVNERYQNDGIARHFDYDAVITGTSMTENCRATVVDELFNVKSVPLCNSGGTYKEISDQLVRVLSYNDNVKVVIRGLDIDMMMLNKDYVSRELPSYLYDDSVLNDVNYLLNKEAIVNSVEVLWRTMRDYEPTSLDDYTNWMDDADYGEEELRAQYSPSSVVLKDKGLDYGVLSIVEDNVRENVLKVALDNPDVEFYYFVTPYSIFYFDRAYRAGELSGLLAIEEKMIRMLTGYDNIHVYSYLDSGRFIEDLDSYRDILHYCEWVNTEILEEMAAGINEITDDNVDNYIARRNDYFAQLDLDSLFN